MQVLTLIILWFACLVVSMAAQQQDQQHAVGSLPSTSTPGSTTFGTIEGILRKVDEMPVSNTKIALNNGDQITYSKVDGTFAFYNVPPGVHLIDVYSPTLAFGQVKVQLLSDSNMDHQSQPQQSPPPPPKCIEYPYPGAAKILMTKYPLELVAHAKYEYFTPKKGFSMAMIFKNPMMLMMAVSIGIMFLMPKMMENMEPEERERMQKQMAQQQQDPTKMLASLWQDMSSSGTATTSAAGTSTTATAGRAQAK